MVKFIINLAFHTNETHGFIWLLDALLFASHLFFRPLFISLVRFIIVFVISFSLKGPLLPLIYFCFEGATISSASLQTLIKELKEETLEFCKFPFFTLTIL